MFERKHAWKGVHRIDSNHSRRMIPGGVRIIWSVKSVLVGNSVGRDHCLFHDKKLDYKKWKKIKEKCENMETRYKGKEKKKKQRNVKYLKRVFERAG